MTRRADKVKQLFEQALDLPDGERQAFVARACDGDAALEREVGDLLRALAAATGFLTEHPRREADEEPGTVIDRFELIERIGEGGFGVVFRAMQREPVRREVALKILKLGMDSRSVVARFERERQALARMQHPNIAVVFDAGTTRSGRPYFVMELVTGQPVTAYCREHGLGIEERIGLLIEVCQAVQHAHQKGIVHRDLKPANVLVSTGANGQPQPKVIDFGIAKAMDPEDDDPAMTATRHGQAIGTLEYMPPEQALGHLELLDSRADVYSLGVMLYELLVGRRPFERADADTGTTDMTSRIRDESPVKPSSRVAKTGDALPLPGADRVRWARRMRGDLDWIAARALAKDPDARYPTPSALAADLQSFLDGRPVDAGPPSAGYLLRRFLGRHRALAIAAGALLVSLLAGFVATSLALGDARSEAASKSRTLDAMRDLLLAADPHAMRGPNFTVREMLDEFAPRIDGSFADDPDIDCDLHLTVGGAYRNLSQLDAAERHLGRALTLARRNSDDVATYQRVLTEWASLQRDLGRHGEAVKAIEEALRLARQREPEGPDVAELSLLLADLYRLEDRDELGEPLVQPALDRLAKIVSNTDVVLSRALGMDLLGSFAQKRGDTDTAFQHFIAAEALRASCLPAGHVLMATSWINLATAHRDRGDFDAAVTAAERALECQRKAFGEEHPMVANSIALLGELAMARGQFDAAAKRFGRAQTIRETALPVGHPQLASAQAALGRVALMTKRAADAETYLRRALELRQAAGGAEDRALAGILQNLGIAVDRQGRLDEAEELYERALQMHRRFGGDANPGVHDALTNLAQLAGKQGDPARAIDLHGQALALRQRYQPENLRAQIGNHSGIVWAAKDLDDPAAGAAAQAARAELMARIAGTNPAEIAATQTKAVRLYLAAGDAVAATPLIEAAYAFCMHNIPTQWPCGECASLLAACRVAAGNWDEAVRHADEGWELLRDSQAPRAQLRQCLETVMAAHRGAAEATEDPSVAEQHRGTAAAAERRLATLGESSSGGGR